MGILKAYFKRRNSLSLHIMYAIITGAGSGIGKAIALRLSSMGFTIASATRKAEIIPALGRELKNAHPEKRDHFICHADISDEQSCHQFISTLPEEFACPQLLVLNAGQYAVGEPSQLNRKDLLDAIDSNASHAIQICNSLLPSMIKQNQGSVVFIGSIVNHTLRKEATAYTLAKNMLNQYALMLQEEIRNTGIRICRIQPGSVNTPSFDGEQVPREAFVQPEQIAEALTWIVNLPPSVQVEELIIRPTDKNW